MTFFDAKRSAGSEPHRRAQLRADHLLRLQKRTESQWVLTVGKKAKKEGRAVGQILLSFACKLSEVADGTTRVLSLHAEAAKRAIPRQESG